MEEEYISEYLRIALNMVRLEEGESLPVGFMESLSPNYWEAIEEDMIDQEILDSTKDGTFLNSKGKLKKYIIAHFKILDEIRNNTIDRAFSWTQAGVNILMATL